MKYLSLDVLEDFECIGSACPNTCCAGWSIIVDEDSVNYYQSIEEEFGEKLRNGLTKNNNNTFIKLLPDMRCPFLTDENLCEVYMHLGKEHMCHTCTYYPRASQLYGDILFQGYTISCPEVARKILSYENQLMFHFGEAAPLPDINNEKIQNETDWERFNTLIKGFTTSVDIIQNQSFSLATRLQLMLLLNDSLQNHLKNDKDCLAIFDLFSDIDYLNKMNQSLNKSYTAALSIHTKMQFFTYFLNHIQDFKNINHIEQMLPESSEMLSKYNAPTNITHLQSCFETLSKTDSVKYENYAVYYLWRYYMKSYKKHNPKKYITIFCYLYALHCCFGAAKMLKNQSLLTLEQQIDIFSHLARMFEHSANDRKLNLLYTLEKNNGMDEMTFLLSLLA